MSNNRGVDGVQVSPMAKRRRVSDVQSLAVRNWSRGTGTIVSVVWSAPKVRCTAAACSSRKFRAKHPEVSGPWLQRQPDRFNESSDDALRDQLPRRSHQPRGHRSHQKNARGNQHVVKSSRTVHPALPEGRPVRAPVRLTCWLSTAKRFTVSRLRRDGDESSGSPSRVNLMAEQ